MVAAGAEVVHRSSFWECLLPGLWEVAGAFAEILSRLSRFFLQGCPEGIFLFKRRRSVIMKEDEPPISVSAFTS
jgi:hypothetical protein